MKYIISVILGLPAVLTFGLFVWFTLYYPTAAATILVTVLLSYVLGSKIYDRYVLPKMGKPKGDGPHIPSSYYRR